MRCIISVRGHQGRGYPTKKVSFLLANIVYVCDGTVTSDAYGGKSNQGKEDRLRWEPVLREEETAWPSTERFFPASVIQVIYKLLDEESKYSLSC